MMVLAVRAAGMVGGIPDLILAAEGGEGGHGGGAVIPPTVWGILVFLTVLVILWRKAFPPILQALEKRAQLIRESLEAAERARKEAAEAATRQEDAMEKARVEARAIIEEGKADAHRVKDKIVEDAKREAGELVARARREIDLAKDNAVDELHRQAVDLSMEIASKVIRKTLRPEDHRELIADSIKRFQEMKEAR
jgi:F-type H+-transporting ATPase subunit b